MFYDWEYYEQKTYVEKDRFANNCGIEEVGQFRSDEFHTKQYEEELTVDLKFLEWLAKKDDVRLFVASINQSQKKIGKLLIKLGWTATTGWLKRDLSTIKMFHKVIRRR